MRPRLSARTTGLLSAAPLVFAGASSVASAATTTTASQRTARPDLVITAVSLSARSVMAGHSVTVTATTKDSGTAAAGASTTGFYLSRDKTWAKSDPPPSLHEHSDTTVTIVHTPA